MTVIDRFLKYVSFDTMSDESTGTHPSTAKQLKLGQVLADELSCMGLENAHLDEFGYVYGWLPASAGCEDIPTLGLVAHMDTSPSAPGANIQPRITEYLGGELVLNAAEHIVLSPEYDENLSRYLGQRLIVTDGTTLLGADDKAGVAEIFSAIDTLVRHPERKHGRVAVCITPDEEIGGGTDCFNVEKFGAVTAYTVDGGELGEIEYENFNGANATIECNGINIHPGSAKNKMRNAILLANEFINLLPPAETPAHTEGYEGFFHVQRIEGDETQTNLHLLIRDHDRTLFENRKTVLGRAAAYLNGKYGEECVRVFIQDNYYNMREMIEPHMELIENAKIAMERAGVTPMVVPIRGGTDGARLSYMGVPCPNLSTGGINFHSVHEYIPVASLEKMVDVVLNLIEMQK